MVKKKKKKSPASQHARFKVSVRSLPEAPKPTEQSTWLSRLLVLTLVVAVAFCAGVNFGQTHPKGRAITEIHSLP